MSTNGSPDVSNDMDIDDMAADLLEDELELGELVSGYVAFEQLVGTLIWASAEADLRLYDASNQVDTSSLERRFSACCVPTEWMPPVELWAEVRFQWPAEYTALSLYGDGVFCDLYHPEDEACRHREGMADIFVDLEIDFLMPFDFVQQLDSDEGIEVTSRRIRQAFAEEVDHDNIVRVEAKASYDGTDLRLVSIKARYFWILQDELRDLSMLKAVLLSICEEIHRVLQRFNRAFVPPGGSSSP